MPSPYQTPDNLTPAVISPEELKRKRRFWGWMIALAAMLTVIGPLSCVIRAGIAMNKAFAQLSSTAAGDTKQLSETIGEIIIATVSSLIITLPVIIFLIISIVRFRRLRMT